MPRSAPKMFLGSAKNLEANKEWINELNVFPVPDGDTRYKHDADDHIRREEVASLENPEMEPLCKAEISSGSRGARGNSRRYPVPASAWFTKGIET